MKILLLIASFLFPFHSFAKSEEQIRKERNYKGGWDEQDIQVQTQLPATYKTPRKYYETKLQNQNERLPASHEEE